MQLSFQKSLSHKLQNIQRGGKYGSSNLYAGVWCLQLGMSSTTNLHFTHYQLEGTSCLLRTCFRSFTLDTQAKQYQSTPLIRIYQMYLPQNIFKIYNFLSTTIQFPKHSNNNQYSKPCKCVYVNTLLQFSYSPIYFTLTQYNH